jgi:hypothetical protein
MVRFKYKIKILFAQHTEILIEKTDHIIWINHYQLTKTSEFLQKAISQTKKIIT